LTSTPSIVTFEASFAADNASNVKVNSGSVRMRGSEPGNVAVMSVRKVEREIGIDRLIRNIRTGRFERMLSGLTGAGALVTAAEIYFEHDRASVGNKNMYLPVLLGPLGLVAGIGGVVSKPVAKTVLPAVSALIVANGVQGFFLHVRGIGQRPGGWKLARYNVEMGPPLFAPLLLTMVGGMGLLAAILRREGE